MEFALEEVPEDCLVETAFGLPRKRGIPRSVTQVSYEIRLIGNRVRENTMDLPKDDSNPIWYEEQVDISSLSGRKAVIRFTARKEGNDKEALFVWLTPRVKVEEKIPWTECSPANPNILVVLVDTLRADHLGCYGYSRNISPNLDDFASKARLFQCAVAPSSWTWPSTASVLTGQYPLNHGVVDAARSILDRAKTSIAEICLENGMHTAAFVANDLISKSKQFDQGFLTFQYLPQARANRLVDAFADWLKVAKKGRFFAYLHFMDPHHPFDPPEEYAARFTAPEDGSRLSAQDFGKLRGQINRGLRKPTADDQRFVQNALDRYDGEILFWDEQFGRIQDLLERYGLSSSTVVAVISDHGEAFLENNVIGHGFHLFDTCLHVPLVIKGPGITPGRFDGQVELISITPTLLQLAHVDSGTAVFDGPPLPEPGKPPVDQPAYAHTEQAFTPGYENKRLFFAVRTKKWKLLIDSKMNEFKLFDLENDPEESENLRGDPEHSYAYGMLKRAFERWYDKYNIPARDKKGEVDAETLKMLEQLGYVDYRE